MLNHTLCFCYGLCHWQWPTSIFCGDQSYGSFPEAAGHMVWPVNVDPVPCYIMKCQQCNLPVLIHASAVTIHVNRSHSSFSTLSCPSSNKMVLTSLTKICFRYWRTCKCRWCKPGPLKMQLGLHPCALFLQPHHLEVGCSDLLWQITVMLSAELAVQVF